MVSGIEMNKGYGANSSYIMMPLSRDFNGLTISSTAGVPEQSQAALDNLDSLKAADSNGDNIISLDELGAYQDKDDFLNKLFESMQKFDSQTSWERNLFEYSNK